MLLKEYDCGPKGLEEAITEGKLDIMDCFIDHKSSSSQSFNAQYMFRLAIDLNQVNVVDYLLNTRDIDINKQDNIFNRLPLEIAIRNSHETMIDYLLEHGARCADRSVLNNAIWGEDAKCAFLKKLLAKKIQFEPQKVKFWLGLAAERRGFS